MSKNDEWYTPEYYVELARKVLGILDLDPASNIHAQQWVKAEKFYTKEDNGLEQPWSGNIWCNPPYSRELIGKFVDKLLESDCTEAIFLTNNATQTKWGNKLLRNCDAVCFPDHRISFWDKDKNPSKGNLYTQMFTYFGNDPERFRQHFQEIGVVMKGMN